MIYKSSKYLKEDFDFNKVKKYDIQNDYEFAPCNVRLINSKLNKSIFDIISSFKNKKCSKLKKLFKHVGNYPKLGNIWSYHKGIINIVELDDISINLNDRLDTTLFPDLDNIAYMFNTRTYCNATNTALPVEEIPDFICEILDQLDFDIKPFKSWKDLKDNEIYQDSGKILYLLYRISPDNGIIIFEEISYHPIIGSGYYIDGFKLAEPIMLYTGQVLYN